MDDTPLNASWNTPEGLASLAEALAREGYRIDQRQVAEALDLLLVMAARGQPVDRSDRAAELLAPLFCSSPDEQEHFRARFEEHFGAPVCADPGGIVHPPARRAQKSFGSRQVQAATAHLQLIAGSWLGAIALAVFFGEAYISRRDPNADSAQLIRQTLQGVLADNGLAMLAIGVFLLLVLAPVIGDHLWVLWRRRRFLRHAQSNETSSDRQLRIPDVGGGLFAAERLRRLARSARRHRRVPTRRLNVAATIRHTLANGGWLTPQYATRAASPEYLVVIERRSARDHLAELARTLFNLLDHHGVFVDRYDFRGDARRVRSARDGRICDLFELHRRHPDHCLLIVADGSCFVDPYSGRPWSWLALFHAWEERVLWTPRPPSAWGRDEAQLTDHFVLLPLGASPTEALIPAAQSEADLLPDDPLMMPGTFRYGADRWLSRIALDPQLIDPGLASLGVWLGAGGYQWLAACAIYPQISWPLTLFLGQQVKDESDTPLLDTDSLIKLCQLPWMRAGQMPDWLRRPLLGHLTPKVDGDARAALDRVFLGQLGGKEAIELAADRPRLARRLVRSLLRPVRRRAPTTSPLRDQVFTGFLRGRSAAMPLSAGIWSVLRSPERPSTAPESGEGIRLLWLSGLGIGLFGLLSVIGLTVTTAAIGTLPLLAALALAPGWMLGTVGYHAAVSASNSGTAAPSTESIGVRLMIAQARAALGGSLIWSLAVAAVLITYGTSVAVSLSEALAHWPELVLTVVAIPLALILFGLAIGMRRALRGYRRADEAGLRRQRRRLLQQWSDPRLVLFIPALLALVPWLLKPTGLTDASDTVLGQYAALIFAGSGASVLIQAGLHGRVPTALRLGLLYLGPAWIMFAWLVLTVIVQAGGNAIDELAYTALAVYLLVGGLQAREMRHRILRS